MQPGKTSLLPESLDNITRTHSKITHLIHYQEKARDDVIISCLLYAARNANRVVVLNHHAAPVYDLGIDWSRADQLKD